jgi:hypothetical protein
LPGGLDVRISDPDVHSWQFSSIGSRHRLLGEE